MTWHTWGDAYNSWLAKGCDHGYAAYRADQWEERQKRKLKAKDKMLQAAWNTLLDTAEREGHAREPDESEFDFLARLIRKSA